MVIKSSALAKLIINSLGAIGLFLSIQRFNENPIFSSLLGIICIIVLISRRTSLTATNEKLIYDTHSGIKNRATYFEISLSEIRRIELQEASMATQVIFFIALAKIFLPRAIEGPGKKLWIELNSSEIEKIDVSAFNSTDLKKIISKLNTIKATSANRTYPQAG